MGTATRSTPQKLRIRPVSLTHPPPLPLPTCSQIYAKNVSTDCRKTFTDSDISLSIKLEKKNRKSRSFCQPRPQKCQAHTQTHTHTQWGAVVDICYLLRFVYITLYLKSGIPRLHRQGPQLVTGCSRRESEFSPPPFPLPRSPFSTRYALPFVIALHISTTLAVSILICVYFVHGRGRYKKMLWAWHVNRG